MGASAGLAALLVVSGVGWAQSPASSCTPEDGAAAAELCGRMAAPPDFPGYAPGEVGAARLRVLAAARDAYATQADAYVGCLEAVLAGEAPGGDSVREAAWCARAWALEQRADAVEAWGMTCLAYEDRTGRTYDEPCFPPEP